MDPRSLYVHVPFCVRRCSYCDFAVEAVREPPVDDWLESIAIEIELAAREHSWSLPLGIDTFYVGGGTPSLLGQGVMSKLVDRLTALGLVRLSADAEWTCEANPESFTAALARDWRAAGVNRVSLGVQSFHEPTLRWMGRLHGPDGARAAVDAAFSAGLEDLSLDLIFGVPAALNRDWEADLLEIVSLAPRHVSLYGLTAEAGAPLGRWVEEGRAVLADQERYAEEYLLAHRVLGAAGYEAYEVSNFARDGASSRHNGAYWTGAPYAAAGPGAHAFQPPLREWNVRSWSAYRSALKAGKRPIEGAETVDPEGAALERVWLSLRTREGFDLDQASDRELRLVERWIADGLAVRRPSGVRLTPEGWLLLDRLAVDLHDAGSRGRRRRGAIPGIDQDRPLVQISANLNADRSCREKS